MAPPLMSSSSRRRWDERVRDDKGYVMAMTALMIVPLIVFTAFAVDVGAWYAQATKVQRAADAAALAGVPYMPGNFAQATSAALSVTRRDGFQDSAVTVSRDTNYPNRLKVAIRSNGPIFFGGAGGVQSEPLMRFAIAEFNQNLQMGSPINFIGRDPDVDPQNLSARASSQQPMWLNTAAYANQKINGDRFTASDCSGSTSSALAPCSGSGPGTNPEFSNDGYFYTVDVGANNGPLDIQAFDPASIHTNDFCTSNLVGLGTGPTDPGAPINQLISRYTAQGLIGTGPGQISDPLHRWGAFAANAVTPPSGYTASDLARGQTYCNGTWVGNGRGGTNVKTTWIVRAPDGTATDHTDNKPICAITFDSYNQSMFNLLDPLSNPNWNTGAGTTEQVPMWRHFRQWFTLCRIANPVTGKYMIQVRQNADVSSPGSTPQTAATSGDGSSSLDIGTLASASTAFSTDAHHRYSLRAGWTDDAPPSPTGLVTSVFDVNSWMAGLAVYADTHLPLYANTGSGGPQFYLARVTPQYKGNKIRISLWDIGDGATGTLTIIAPPDATGTGGPLTSCTWDRDGGVFPGGVAGCTASGLSSANFNGHMTNATLQLAADYSCNSAAATGCWFRIQVAESGQPNDTTTWSAAVIGNPVHLVQ